MASSIKATKCSDADAVSFLPALPTVVGELWAVQHRSCTSWCAHLHSPVRQGVAPQHRSASCWADQLVSRLWDHLWLRGLTHVKDQNLGISIRVSTDFNRQGPDEMTGALMIAQVTAAHYESWLQLFEGTSCSPLPLSSCPNSWGLSILTPRTLDSCLFVCLQGTM